MPSKLLNSQKVKSAKPTDKEYVLNDGDGLRLRVRPQGSKDWFYVYKRTGSNVQTKVQIGSYPTISLEQAREAAYSLRRERYLGIDPKTAKDEARRQVLLTQRDDGVPKTVSELVDYWVVNYLTVKDKNGRMRRKDGGKEILRSFGVDVLPLIGFMRLHEVKRIHIAKILHRIMARGCNRSANITLSNLRQLFGFALSRGLMETLPTSGLAKRDYGGIEEARTRTLSEFEITELGRRLPAAGMTDYSQAALWISLATLCRVGEISRARWEFIDLTKGEWIIPADMSKNSKEHLIHLSPFAIRHFRAIKDMGLSSSWVVPAERKADTHISVKTIQKQVRDRQRATVLKGRSKQNQALILSGGDWVFHDLRRTGATMMGELGIRPDIIDLCQNHIQENRVTKTYQRQEMMGARKSAFLELGELLERLLSSETEPLPSLKKDSPSMDEAA